MLCPGEDPTDRTESQGLYQVPYGQGLSVVNRSTIRLPT
eukprot:CAMPEP_0183831492 /NCGR_PEP_ID=MMETSP0807_2-20130328/4715_1 /TAXON_ID=88271 /ORGANISM="Picocystis salinarum, Strain CCMP1897" /LENGTH=38 /DNA_ID= /DNA_START= /DNA_END= /DNA_ORIENTATION=